MSSISSLWLIRFSTDDDAFFKLFAANCARVDTNPGSVFATRQKKIKPVIELITTIHDHAANATSTRGVPSGPTTTKFTNINVNPHTTAKQNIAMPFCDHHVWPSLRVTN